MIFILCCCYEKSSTNYHFETGFVVHLFSRFSVVQVCRETAYKRATMAVNDRLMRNVNRQMLAIGAFKQQATVITGVIKRAHVLKAGVIFLETPPDWCALWNFGIFFFATE